MRDLFRLIILLEIMIAWKLAYGPLSATTSLLKLLRPNRDLLG